MIISFSLRWLYEMVKNNNPAEFKAGLVIVLCVLIFIL